MPRVDFHSQVSDKLLYTCRLLRKAYNANSQAIVLTSDDEQCAQLDRLLWEFSATDFLPHVQQADPLSTETPIVLTSNLDATLPHFELLINLSQVLPEAYQRFARVIEIVSSEEQDAHAGRQRFRLYQQQGIQPSHTVAKTT